MQTASKSESLDVSEYYLFVKQISQTQTSKFAVFRTVCEIYLTNSSEPYIKLKPQGSVV